MQAKSLVCFEKINGLDPHAKLFDVLGFKRAAEGRGFGLRAATTAKIIGYFFGAGDLRDMPLLVFRVEIVHWFWPCFRLGVARQLIAGGGRVTPSLYRAQVSACTPKARRTPVEGQSGMATPRV